MWEQRKKHLLNYVILHNSFTLSINTKYLLLISAEKRANNGILYEDVNT